MKRARSILGSAIFLVIAPGTVAGLLPWTISRWHFHPAPLVPRIVGGLLILAGLPVLLDCFARFALEGLGTPAPPLPTEHLVVRGLYRYVRNPMYIAVVSLIFGQALLFASMTLAWYGAAVWAFFHLLVLFMEEPMLRARFGAEYEAFVATVPRWIPRLRPARSG